MAVAGRARHVEGPRRDQGKQLMLVHREVRIPPSESPIITAKPIREMASCEGNIFSLDVPCQGCPSQPGLAADGCRETLILCSSPQRRHT
jgi:hypothetical protein